MRLSVLLPLILLAACQSTAPVGVGSAAWLGKVDSQLSISDGQGHGPDHGSQEWCNAVHFKLYGQHAAGPVPCDQAWMEETDRALRQGPAATPAPTASSCGISFYKRLIGTSARDIDLAVMPPRTRIIRPGALVTQDYWLDRLNVHVDRKGLITELRCG
ncbi:hypothetical protein H0A66_16015 [Alcaligenaceae bacterium]|nr:hypothetical protein [Alcaligenaceae bacterium]